MVSTLCFPIENINNDTLESLKFLLHLINTNRECQQAFWRHCQGYKPGAMLVSVNSSSRSCVVVLVSPFWWFSEPFLGDFRVVVLRPFSLGFGGVCMLERFVVIFPLIPLPNPWAKGLNLGVFIGLGFVVFLAEILRFLLIQWVLVDHNLAMKCSWGVPNIPSLVWIGGAIREIGSWIWGSWPAGAVHPELPRHDRSDRCKPLVGFCLGELLCSCGCVPLSCWSVLGLFGVGFLGFVRGFPSLQVVFWW
jgi:hypothetical protein